MLINAARMPSLHKVIFKKEYILVARKMNQSLKGSLDLVVFSSSLPPKTISETLVSVFCFVSLLKFVLVLVEEHLLPRHLRSANIELLLPYFNFFVRFALFYLFIYFFIVVLIFYVCLDLDLDGNNNADGWSRHG